ncbi:MAG TPA: NrsF family protein [Methylocystis sp.]
MKTEELIHALADDEEAKPYIHPMYCAAIWFAASLGYFLLLLLILGRYSDLFAQLTDWRSMAVVAAALTTSMVAAAAACCSTCPGRPNWERFAPAPFLLAWGAIFFSDAGRGSGLPQIGVIDILSEWYVLPIALSAAVAPAAAMFFAVRRGAPIAPRLTMSLAGLAVAVLSAASMRLTYCSGLCPSVRFWQLTSVLTIVGLFALLGPSHLRWRTTSELLEIRQFQGLKSPKR